MAARKTTSRRGKKEPKEPKEPPKIIQLIPRQDSVHAYFEVEDDDGHAVVESEEVLAWGLRSDGTVTGLFAPEDEGTAGALEPVDGCVHFMGYSGPGAHKAYEERLDGEPEEDEEEDGDED